MLKTDEIKGFSLTGFLEHKYEDESSLKADVESGKLQYGFVFENGKTYKIITKGGAVGEIKAIVDTSLLNFNREKVLKENNVNPNIANALFDIKINSDVLDLNRNAKGNIFFARKRFNFMPFRMRYCIWISRKYLPTNRLRCTFR